jgi:hypothetical protein
MRGTAVSGAVARLLAACAVLVGLFLMHGLPAQSCAAGSGMATTAHPLEAAPVPAMAHPPAAGTAMPGSAGHGTACVALPAPRGVDVLLALLLLAVATALLPAVRAVGDAARHPSGRRAPPGGAALLTRLCVSRT